MKRVRKEIGSEFWDIPTAMHENGLFPENTHWFLSGRSALECILADIQKHNRVRSVAMPAWCCDSMVKPFVDVGIRVCFYSVHIENHRLVQDLSQIADCDILFKMDYFGYDVCEKTANFSNICIQDMTHSIFSSKSEPSDYVFGSLRKWAGFYTGGFGWGFDLPDLPQNTEYIALRKAAMKEKNSYISGASNDKTYLDMFAQAETILEHCEPALACDQDIAAAKHLDVDFIKNRRRANAKQLLDAFSDIVLFKELQPQDCPLFVPILVPNGKRDELRKFLIQNKIYCPVHWPLTKYQQPTEQSLILYRDSLSLVCDQRYSKEDMDRLIETVKNF